jgi:hypothetical protein
VPTHIVTVVAVALARIIYVLVVHGSYSES